MIIGTIFRKVPVHLTMRHVCRQTPLFATWVGVCAVKDCRHDAAIKIRVDKGAVG